MDIQLFKEQLFSEGIQAGFSDMEIEYGSIRKFSTKIYKGEKDSYDISEEGGISFRGQIDDRMGYAYTEKIAESSIPFLLDEAKENASVIDNEEESIIFAGAEQYAELNLYSSELAGVTNEEKINLLKTIEKKVFTLSDLIHSLNYCMLVSNYHEKVIANTKGLNLREATNALYVLVSVVVKDGKAFKNAYKLEMTREISDIDPDKLAQEVVDEALSYRGAETIGSGEYPIILKNKAAASLLQAFSTVFSAEEVQKGKSKLAEKLGNPVGNETVTIVDDPHFKNGFASRSFDSEGVPTRKVTLVEKGILKTFIHNLKTAKKENLPSTGHASRASYKSIASIAPSNLYIESGTTSYEELVAGEKKTLIITSLQGLHSGLNPISGDFSLAAHGYLIEDGKVTRPINQITVAGNFFTMLHDIHTVANDLDFSDQPDTGYVGSPSLKVEKLSVGGE